MVNFGELRWPHLYVVAAGIFPDILRSVQMLRESGVRKATGNYPQRFIPSKTVTLFPEFAVEDLPLGRTAAFVPEFAVKGLPLGKTH